MIVNKLRWRAALRVAVLEGEDDVKLKVPEPEVKLSQCHCAAGCVYRVCVHLHLLFANSYF